MGEFVSMMWVLLAKVGNFGSFDSESASVLTGQINWWIN